MYYGLINIHGVPIFRHVIPTASAFHQIPKLLTLLPKKTLKFKYSSRNFKLLAINLSHWARVKHSQRGKVDFNKCNTGKCKNLLVSHLLKSPLANQEHFTRVSSVLIELNYMNSLWWDFTHGTTTFELVTLTFRVYLLSKPCVWYVSCIYWSSCFILFAGLW